MARRGILERMLACLFLLAEPPSAFDSFAAAKDVAALESRSAPALAKTHPFGFLRTTGAYGTGRYGWRARDLADVDGTHKYVVFTTPLTSEDTGEQVFEVKAGMLQRHIPESDAMGFKIERHTFDVSFALERKQANVDDLVAFRRNGPKRASFLVRTGPNYKVTSITEAGKAVRFKQAGGTLSIAAPAKPTFAYRIRYSGVLDKPMFAGSISTEEAFLTNDVWWLSIARAPAPCSVKVVVPKGWTAVGQGEMVSRQNQGASTVFHYRMDIPVSIYSLSAAAYKVASKTVDGRKFSVWSLRMAVDAADVQADLYAPIFKFYERFAPYPFSSYGAVVSDVYGGGALEAYSFATYGGGIPADDAHEPSHTWWGGLIPNTYLKSLWNESFAVYCDGLYQREGAPGNREERRFAFISDASPDNSYLVAPPAAAPSEIGGAASAIGYGKGAKVLQMLEAEIGTEKMLACMREWLRVHKKGEAGEWEGFEAVCGWSYRWFFDQWLRRTGWAEFQVSNVNWSSGFAYGDVSFKGDPYQITCEVMLQFADGRREFAKAPFLSLRGGGYRFSVPCPAKPALVSVDPWRRLLRTYKADEEVPDIQGAMFSFQKFVDPAHKDWMPHFGRGSSAIPSDLDGWFIVGSPETVPTMKPLCAKAGFEVNGDLLTYKGTTIDLKRGCALALVDLGDGKSCLIGLGKTRLSPNPGRSQVCVTDNLGRFIRGRTEPKTKGWMTFRLD